MKTFGEILKMPPLQWRTSAVIGIDEDLVRPHALDAGHLRLE